MIRLLKKPIWLRRVTVALAILIGFVTLLPASQLTDASSTNKLRHIVIFKRLLTPTSFTKRISSGNTYFIVSSLRPSLKRCGHKPTEAVASRTSLHIVLK